MGPSGFYRGAVEHQSATTMPDRPTIGVLTPLIGGFYYAHILSGVQRAAQLRGARVVAFQTSGMDMLWSDEPGTLPLGWDRIDGYLGINNLEGRSYYESVQAAGKPLVTLSARMDQGGATAVLPENFEGTVTAVRHLLKHGHRRIGFAGTLSQLDMRERYEGYKSALREAGIEPDPDLFFPMSCTLELEGHATGQRIVEAGVPFTALVTCTDLNAIGIMQQLRGAGYRIPEDIAIVGFDDIEAARYMDPPLSTVRQGFSALAAAGTDVLLDRVLDGIEMPETVRVPVTFVPRHSCGCVGYTTSTVSLSTHPGETDRVERLRSLLVRFYREHAQAVLSQDTENLWPGAGDLASHIVAVVDGSSGLPARQLGGVWREFLQGAHDVESVEGLISLIEDAVNRWLRDDNADDRRTADARARARELRFEFMREWRSVEQARRRYYDSITEANRKINLALIGADLENAQNLDWLGWARVSHGWLGTWMPAQKDRPRELKIVSTFAKQASVTLEPGDAWLPHEFPHQRVYAELDGANPEDIVTVIPLTSKTDNRGLLTVIGPIEKEVFDDTGTLAQWAALLSAAMDRAELLESLRDGFERERHIARTLRESEERYALAARGANDGLWDWSIATGAFYCSPRFKAILGCDEHEATDHIEGWFSRVHPEDLPGLKAALEDHFAGEKAHIEHEYRIVSKGGSARWVLCRGVAVFDESGRPVRAAGSQAEITPRKEAEEQLRRTALHDALTGLPNRALLTDRLEQAIRRSRRDGTGFAVLFLDLDRFKTINDSLGHLSGDQLLVQIAERLVGCMREADTVARLGGDEFAMVVSDVATMQEAVPVAERVHEALRAPFQIQGHRVFTSASIGITLSSERYERADDFLRDADTAMYSAKTRGRARHEMFDARMHDQAMERLSLEAGLRHALERNEFVLHYQPLVSLRSGTVMGLEALIRWQHPERGLLYPDVFLPLAEETGLIIPISEWALRAACQQNKKWQKVLSRTVRISVNLTPQQLRDPSLPKLFEAALSEAGLQPSALGIELVESSLIESTDPTARILHTLKQMGILIAVDDFGTGYSSLSYLKRFPIDYLKIDRSFTQGVPHDVNDTAISTAIIAMARSLNLTVVAEGVETRDQAEFLRAQGCDMVQGYYFSKPLDPESCLAYLKQSDIQNLKPTGTV